MTLTRVMCVLCVPLMVIACSSMSAGTGGTTGNNETTTTQTVGASGGTVTSSGITLTIPAGALSVDTAISITPNAAPVPSGYDGESPVYQFEPEGTVFAVAVTVTFTIASTAADDSVYWSNASGGFDAVPTTETTSTASAQITHFSRGFVGHDDSEGASDGGGDGALPDASASQDSGASLDSGVAEGGADGGSGSAISAMIDGTMSTFAYAASTNDVNGLVTIQANDSPTTTYWQIQILATTIIQQTCSANSTAEILYTHYTGGAADETFTTKQAGGTCLLMVSSSPGAPGTQASGTFTATVAQAGGGTHSLTSGQYAVTR